MFSNASFQKMLVSAKCASLSIAIFSSAAFAQTNAPAPAGDAVITPGATAVAGGASAASSAPAPWMNLVLFGGIFVFMYFFMIRPQMKRQKEQKAFVESLRVGQEVITSGGILGRIVSMADTIITLDVGNSTIRVLRSSVSAEVGASNNSQIASPAVAK